MQRCGAKVITVTLKPSTLQPNLIGACKGYNVLALGQHLDDVVESFFMAMFFNGVMRTIKANYTLMLTLTLTLTLNLTLTLTLTRTLTLTLTLTLTSPKGTPSLRPSTTQGLTGPQASS